jgi:hypothetical protein
MARIASHLIRAIAHGSKLIMDNVTVAVQTFIACLFHAFLVGNLDIVKLELFLFLLLEGIFVTSYTVGIDPLICC